MKGLFQLLLLSGFATLLSAEVLDFGDLKIYENKGEAPDGVQPDAIWVMPAEGGFTVALGEDVRKKVEGILGSCKEKDDKCFQDLSAALQDARIQQDHHLDSKRFVLAATAVVSLLEVAVSALEGALAGLAVAGGAWLINKPGKGTFVPEEAASNAAKMPEATPITISADGSAVATVTKKPVATKLEGAVTPSVAVVTASADGNKKVDLDAILDPQLASRLDEIFHRSTSCQAGADLDKEYPSRKRQKAGSYGGALCAAKAAMGGVRANGPLTDLLHLASTGAHFNFREAAGPVFAAANEMADFVREWAPMMALPAVQGEAGVPEEFALQVGNFVLALAIDTIVEMKPLQEKNRIKGESVTVTATSTSEPTSSSSACPKRTDIVCGFKGAEHCGLELKDVGNRKRYVCKNTDLKGCECVGPGLSHINIMPDGVHQAILAFNKIPDKKEIKPKCSQDVTNLPTEVFSSGKSTVYNHFCKGWNKNKEYKMTVNSIGENVLPEPHLRKRTPPSKAADYKNDKRFKLSYKPNKDAGDCRKDCTSAFEDFTQFCSASSPGRYMYDSGEIDAGCGTFEYEIESIEVTERKEFPQFCYGPEDFALPDGAKVNTGFFRVNVDSACSQAGQPDREIRKGEKGTFIQTRAQQQGVLYQVNIWWKEDCEMENGQTLVTATKPLGSQNSDSKNSCTNILDRAFSGCPATGGRGGAIQVGCLMYEATTNSRGRDSFGGF